MNGGGAPCECQQEKSLVMIEKACDKHVYTRGTHTHTHRHTHIHTKTKDLRERSGEGEICSGGVQTLNEGETCLGTRVECGIRPAKEFKNACMAIKCAHGGYLLFLCGMFKALAFYIHHV